MYSPVVAFVIPFLVVAFMLPKILILSLRKRLIDPIDVRKVHQVPASRLGGVAFFPAILCALLVSLVLLQAMPESTPLLLSEVLHQLLIMLALLLLYLIGIYDDILGVSYRHKFCFQILAAFLVVGSGTYFQGLQGMFGIHEISPWVGIPLTIGFYVFVTNALNLIDGIDGLASLLSIMACVVYGALFALAGQPIEVLWPCATLGALVPFAYYNLYGVKPKAKSKVFMGDAGALVIGALLSLMAVKLWNLSSSDLSLHPNVFHVLAYTMLLVPCFDVLRIMIHRKRKGCPVFMPDKNHLHHKFLGRGCTSRQTLHYILCMNLFFLLLNVLLASFLPTLVIMLVDGLIWTVFQLVLTRVKQLTKLQVRKASL